MKIAVYTIAKDEAQFVQRWVDSAEEADSLHILDTGSSDSTVTLARDLGVDVARWEIAPWRFDKARNMSLDLVPEDTDLCIALDMDEVLVEGWREHLEAAYTDGVTRPRYQYTWSWEGNRPGLVYGGDKIHARHGYFWKHPVHEVITPKNPEREVQGWYGLEIHHHPDHTKSRGQYLPLLELAVSEDPLDDRNAHYLAREYFFSGRLDEAKAEFQRHLGLPSAKWGAERAQSYRYLYKIDGHHLWLDRALDEDPNRRETLVDYAFYWYTHENWAECLKYATRALAIDERPLEYLTEAEAWGPLAHDIAGVSAWKLGYFHQAVYHGMEALKLNPYDDRIFTNLEHYRKAAA